MNKKRLNKETIKVIKEVNKGINVIGPFNTIKELKDTLRK